MSFDYYQSVIGKMRKGTADDSFIDVNETLQIVNSRVVLSEIPDKFNGLVVKSVFGNETLVEIKKGTPVNNQYLCDYNLGIVHFPDTVNNERYVFSYKGRGSVYLAAERIYTKQMNSEEIIQTLRDVLDEADSIINLSERFTNTGNYSTTKVYYGRNIVTYDNAVYMCINHSADGIINIPPTNTTHWMQMVSVKQAVESANAAASSANTAATNANDAADNAETQATYAKNQGDYAKGIRDNFGHKGDYSSTATYKNGNVVTYGGINYFCIQDTTAGIDPLNGTYWTVVSPQASINDQTWTATEGQTVFTITNGNYVVGQGNMEVWVGGVPQVSGQGYTETNSTTITLSEGVPIGTTVFAKWFEGHMSISKGHKSSHALGGQDEIDLTQMRNYKEKVSDEFVRVDAQLAERANRRTNVFNKQTYGTYGDATVLSAMANELEENPRPQVLGLTSTQHASDYADRDSVAFYTSNRSRKPTVIANSGTITYTGTSVQVTSAVIENLEKVLPGMLIDTYHTPNRWTAFVESVDIASQTITTKDGWFKVQPGGSQTPSTPTNGVGFDVNRLTKVWAINDNVFLYDEDGVDIAVAAEIGLFNYRNGATSMAGFDLVNFANKADYGFQARKSSEAVGGYGYAYIARDSDNAFMAHTTSEEQILLRSDLNGDSNDRGFIQYANGTMNKLRLIAGLFGDGQNIYGSPNQSIFLINKSVEEIFRLPSPVGKAGEMIVVLNVGSTTSTLANENDSGVIVNGTSFVSVRLPRRQSVIFVSDGGAWYSIGLNGISHQQGTTAPTTTPAFIGQEFIDTTNRRVYKAVGVSSSTDWVLLN